ncbi:hypothetical protein QUF70_15825, partial [Desulfobacterales bacterium HSG17]|nr:hypothetical protein [Desulfobacterales bacterium HSG17]
MKIEGKGYNVDFDGKGTLIMSGKLAAMPEEYEKIEEFFEEILEKISDANITELIFDLRELIFLNSSGI